jgi:cyclopropane fatty-acyl-phospholipid synthase-like methyltransferase
MAQSTATKATAVPGRLTPRDWGLRLSAVVRCQLPLLIRGRRTVAGVGAYFDLVTDDGRLYFGDNFHLGYFQNGQETLHEAHDALTDLVADLADIGAGAQVLDVGCGIGEPAVRIARTYGCRITGVNASRRQVRQGRELVAQAGLIDRIDLRVGNALALDMPDASVDSVVCLESAGDICVTSGAREQLVNELWRVLRPGGSVGFGDLAFTRTPTADEDKSLRAVLYHTGSELVGDWRARFANRGFAVTRYRDIHTATLSTWDILQEFHQAHVSELCRRNSRPVVAATLRHFDRLVPAIVRCGTYPTFSAQKPDPASPGVAIRRQ